MVVFDGCCFVSGLFFRSGVYFIGVRKIVNDDFEENIKIMGFYVF